MLGSVVQNSHKRRKSLGKWRRARSTRLCTADRETSPAFGYARHQELIINRDVTCESGLWGKPMSHLERAVLEMFYWLCVNSVCALLAIYFKLFVPASIKKLDCRNKLVSPCKRLSECHSFRFIASKSRGENPQQTHVTKRMNLED